MIVEAFQEIRTALRNEIEDLPYIDFDRGQLDNPTKFATPMMSRLVLINFMDGIEWKTLPKNKQRGEAIFGVKIAIRLPDVQFIEEDVDSNLQSLEICEEVNVVMMKLGGILRLKTQAYTKSTFFVIEHTYKTGFDYEPIVPLLTPYQLKYQDLQINLELERNEISNH